HALALRLVAQLADVDLLGLALLDDLFAVVELQLRHQVALRGRLEAREDRGHRGDLERVRRHVRAEVRVPDDLLVDLHLFGQPQVVRDLHDHDAVEDRLVGVIRLELLPLGLVRVRDDARVDVDHPVAPGRRDDLLLRRGDHRVQVLGLVLEDLDELDDAAVADVERAVQVQDARVAFRVDVELRDVLAAYQDRRVLVVRVDRRDDADADAVPLREVLELDREVLVAAAELVVEAPARDGRHVALDVHAEHLLELFAEMARDELQRLLVHRRVRDRVERLGLLQPALQLLDERALARADRSHEVQDLSALLALQGGGVEVADDLRDRLLDPEELVAEEVVDLERLVLVQALGAGIVDVLNVLAPATHDDVVDA